jgi:hypothetical protein
MSCFELKGTTNNMLKDLVQGSRKPILLTSWVAFCQGAVTGTVLDQQGAVIPNPNVTVMDLGTALKLETLKPAQLCKNNPLTGFQKMN